jgi:hypothetical protein
MNGIAARIHKDLRESTSEVKDAQSSGGNKRKDRVEFAIRVSLTPAVTSKPLSAGVGFWGCLWRTLQYKTTHAGIV